MFLSIPKDYFNNPTPPNIYLCNTARTRLGQLQAYDISGTFKWNSYSEIKFSVDRFYTDLITGEQKICPLFDKIESPRNIYVQNIGYFALQDIDVSYDSKDTKTVSCFSLEYASLSNKWLTNFHVNTGEVDSKEVLYNENVYGLDYSTDADSFYELASGAFDPYESYYQQVYTDTDSYTYEQIQIVDETKYAEYLSKNEDADAQPHEKLFKKRFANVQFYNKNKPQLSLLHLILENVPEWKIGNVDQSLWRKERKLSEDRIAIYDMLTTKLSETFGCVFEFDTINGLINVYEETEDGMTDDNEVATRWETDVLISRDNLASQVSVNYSSDNIKTKLVVTGSDGLDIREVNLGRNEIMDLSFYHTLEWMEQDLFEAYDNYLDAVQEANTGIDSLGMPSAKYPMSYPDAMKGWVSAYNRWNDAMNAIPAEGNVVLIGDEFKKLYCGYTPANTAYTKSTISDSTKWVDTIYSDTKCTIAITDSEDEEAYLVQGYKLVYRAQDNRYQVVENLFLTSESALIKKLNLYHVDEDILANKTDNILLKMKNSASDIATIRIYDKRMIASEYNPDFKYYTKSSDDKYAEILIKDAIDFSNQQQTFGNLYTNNYCVQSVVVKASHGVAEAPDEYSLSTWIQGQLTNQRMNLVGYKITYIGTMGAYFVLSKDETNPENLKDYGVRLLEEKHKTYTSIFQTQTESMFSQEKYQCIAQDDEPEGDYKNGTKWLDTDSKPAVLKEYSDGSWVKASVTMSPGDQYDYENYQRYIDNYEKLRAVQEVLVVKERSATYTLQGYEVPDRRIVLNPTDGSSLEGNMLRAAEAHFNELTKSTGEKYTITRVDLNTTLPLYTFMTSLDPIVYSKNTSDFRPLEKYYVQTAPDVYAPIAIADQTEFDAYDGSTTEKTLYVIASGHIFAVYLKGTTPYVSYENSQGVYQMIMEHIKNATELNKFFTDDQWIRLSPFIREDEYNDDNFLLTGYESEEERIKICNELMEFASKELRMLCRPSLEFSMTMANLLALPEFEPLFHQFQLGNFIRVQIRDDYIKRSRLLEVALSFDDLSDFSCEFGNLVTTKSEIDKHAELLAQAVSAGKTVAKSSSSWQKSVDKTNTLETSIANGLRDAALAVGSASGQAISWDSTGMHFRKYKEGSTTEYEPEEMAIINNSLVATNDSWRTSKAAFGKYIINGEERWGPIAEYVTADTIEGKTIKGGSIQIGDETKNVFIVNEDGSVEIRSGGTNYVNAMKEIDDAYRYRVILTYDTSTIFSDINDNCKITCTIYDYNVDKTQAFMSNGATFSWTRSSYGGDDADWNKAHAKQTSNILIVTTEDVVKNATFACGVEIDGSFLDII